MANNEVKEDLKFIRRCSEYGLNSEDAEVFEDVITVKTPKEELYVLFDKDFNTIGIEENIFNDTRVFAEDFYEEYCRFCDVLPRGKNFGYPFESFTLRDFIHIGNNTDIFRTNNGKSTTTTVKIDGKRKLIDRENNEEYVELLGYIKFISEEIQKYFLMSYHIQMMGYEFPDVYEYVRRLIEKINENINESIKNNETPLPYNILSSLGMDNSEIEPIYQLYDVIDVIMREKEQKEDLTPLTDELLRVFGIDENIRRKEREREIANYQSTKPTEPEKKKVLTLKNA